MQNVLDSNIHNFTLTIRQNTICLLYEVINFIVSSE